MKAEEILRRINERREELAAALAAANWEPSNIRVRIPDVCLAPTDTVALDGLCRLTWAEAAWLRDMLNELIPLGQAIPAPPAAQWIGGRFDHGGGQAGHLCLIGWDGSD